MSAPTLDRHPGSSQAGSSDGRRRKRKLVLVASALIVLALAVGTSLAIATRPVARQDPAATTPVAAAEDQSSNQSPRAGHHRRRRHLRRDRVGRQGPGDRDRGAGPARRHHPGLHHQGRQ